jgi:hypothetical protein
MIAGESRNDRGEKKKVIDSLVQTPFEKILFNNINLKELSSKPKHLH